MKQYEHRSNVRYSQNGFTLYELVTVIAIVVVLVALAVPSFAEWRKDLACREVSKHIVSALRFAKSRAIDTNLEHRVEFDSEKSSYRVMQGDRSINSSDWDTIVYDWTVFPPSVQMDSNVKAIHMNTNGTSNGGTISIQDAEKNTKFKVIVAATGRIRMP